MSKQLCIRKLSIIFFCLALFAPYVQAEDVEDVKREALMESIRNEILVETDVAVRDIGDSLFIAGDHAIVGFPDRQITENQQGTAYVFSWDGSAWRQEAQLVPSEISPDERFAEDVFIAEKYAFAGTWTIDKNGKWSGSTYLFERDSTGWAEVSKVVAFEVEPNAVFVEAVKVDGIIERNVSVRRIPQHEPLQKLDEIDTIRQEYVNYGIPVPPRCKFVDAQSYVNPGHFSFAEINGGDYNWVIFTVANHLENIRTNLGRALTVTSGYRNPVHNAAIGGASQSRHMYGDAADVSTPDFNGDGVISNSEKEILRSAAVDEGADYTETYTNTSHVHMDWRNDYTEDCDDCVSGDVSGHWTTANSPYEFCGNVTVQQGQTLDIDPGVVINYNNYSFTVNGSLTWGQ